MTWTALCGLEFVRFGSVVHVGPCVLGGCAQWRMWSALFWGDFVWFGSVVHVSHVFCDRPGGVPTRAVEMCQLRPATGNFQRLATSSH